VIPFRVLLVYVAGAVITAIVMQHQVRTTIRRQSLGEEQLKQLGHFGTGTILFFGGIWPLIVFLFIGSSIVALFKR
jgi:hypothetical protein